MISDENKKPAAAVRVSARPHPFAAQNNLYFLPAGATLEEMAQKIQPDPLLRRYLRGFINDAVIPQRKWRFIRPKAGTDVRFCSVPMGGGGGKNPLRTVLSLAILASTSFLGTAFAAGALGQASLFGISGGRLISGALSFAGRLALNALAPPPRQRLSSSAKASPTLFIQGAQNRLDPFGKVPQVLGRHRMVPPMGAKPFTETFGDDQYLRMLFVWGYGPLDIADLKIGETPLSEFKDVEIEHRYGFPEDAPLTLYSGSVIQNDLQIALRESEGYHIRTTATDAEEISVDVTFPRGLMVLADGGVRQSRNVVLEVQYAPAGTEAWSAGEEEFALLDVTGNQNNALRKSVRLIVPKGQYDVRIRRITEDSEDESVFDECVWTAVRTLRYEAPIAMTGLAVTALRIKATDQLSGVIDRFNGVVQSIVPDWDGENWVSRATSNPAALFRHVLQGAANARPLPENRLDLAKLENWHALCETEEREFNAVIDYQASVRDVLIDVAAAGRAAPSVIDGKWGVVADMPQAVPVQHFTPRNSSGFRGEKHFDTPPHGLRVRFANQEKYWQQDEMLVYDDGYDAATAVRFETLELPGITDPAQIWRDARYHIATARLRGESYSFTVDIEHLVCTRGDLIRLTHDVPLFGVQAARVKAVSETGGLVTHVLLDEEIEMQAGHTYSVRFRRQDGTSLVKQLVTAAGTANNLQFETPFDLADAPLAGDLAMFGETGQESVELIVQSIRPGPDLTARLTCLDAAPAVHLADQGVIPAFDSHITLPQGLERPPRPHILSVQSGAEVLEVQDGGLFAPQIVVRFAPPAAGDDLELRVKIRDVNNSFFSAARFILLDGDAVSIKDVRTAGIYDLRFFYIRKNGWSSQETLLPNYHVIGTGGAPQDVEGFRISVLGDTAFLSWEAVPDIDLSHYILRFSAATTAASWHEGVDMLPHIEKGASSVAVPALVGTYLLKAVDMQGEQSVSAAGIVSTAAGLSAYNAVAILTEDPAFTGFCDNMAAAGGVLSLSGQDSIDDWGDIDAVTRFDIGLNGLAPEGSYTFASPFDLGAVYSSTLSASVTVDVLDLSAVMDEWGDVDSRLDWDTASGGGAWQTRLQLRTTADDPADAEAVWTEWEDFMVGDYTARGFAFRLLARTEDIFVTPVVSALSVKIDMPDRVDGRENILSDSAGSSVVFNRSFRAIPAIAVSAQDMETGDYYSITETTESGFDIRFFNAAGAGIMRRFDYVAKGYGIRQP